MVQNFPAYQTTYHTSGLIKEVLVIRILLILCALVFSIDNIDIDNAGFSRLTEQQKADIVKRVASLSDSGKKTNAQVFSEWADVGIKIGQDLASCARELNIAVNEFLLTPAGKVTFVMIGWKIMARDIIHVFFSIISLIIGIFVIRIMYCNWSVKNVKFNYEKLDIFKRPTKTYEHNVLSAEEVGGIIAVFALTMIISGGSM